jgi:hypothetical protein
MRTLRVFLIGVPIIVVAFTALILFIKSVVSYTVYLWELW